MSKEEFIDLIGKCREAQKLLDGITDSLLDSICSSFGLIDLSLFPTSAENADNLEEGILCYIQYGEYTPEYLWEEVQKARNGKDGK